MVRPMSFGYNPETAASNAFQKAGAGPADGTQARAEFDAFVRALSGEGVTVCVAEDSPDPPKPDAVFPNNWVSFHGDGTLVLYPMEAKSRRIERRQEIIDQVVKQLGFRVTHFIDLMHHEDDGRYLEGTGSLVLDHAARVAYACASSRTHPELVKEWAEALGYEPLVFQAADSAGLPLYHTNVLLCIGARMAIVGTEAIAPADRQRVLARLRASGRELIEIGHKELMQFAGNMLELGTWDEALGDSRVLVMSDSARRSLDAETFARLSGCTDQVLAVPIPTIERAGGGSVRCMLAEVFRTP
ncbi:MAG TPA: arginine deiminase-related protein [Steroidobacteraceae bacterium]|nr:arginine deiminase-related protein [Steroidobacteraceae bacterium]